MALFRLRAVRRVSYLGSDRFVIREAHGYDMKYESRSSRFIEAPLAALVILDRAYCFAKVHELYLSDIPLGGQGWTHAQRVATLYDRAETYCAELNARVADAQAGMLSL